MIELSEAATLVWEATVESMATSIEVTFVRSDALPLEE